MWWKAEGCYVIKIRCNVVGRLYPKNRKHRTGLVPTPKQEHRTGSSLPQNRKHRTGLVHTPKYNTTYRAAPAQKSNSTRNFTIEDGVASGVTFCRIGVASGVDFLIIS